MSTRSICANTADTLAALRHAQSLGMRHTLAVCNVATSALVRETALSYLTRACAKASVSKNSPANWVLKALVLATPISTPARVR